MTRIVLHIDRLVLRGLPSSQRQDVVAGLRVELARLFAGTQLPGARATQPPSTGQQVARAIHRHPALSIETATRPAKGTP